MNSIVRAAALLLCSSSAPAISSAQTYPCAYTCNFLSVDDLKNPDGYTWTRLDFTVASTAYPGIAGQHLLNAMAAWTGFGTRLSLTYGTSTPDIEIVWVTDDANSPPGGWLKETDNVTHVHAQARRFGAEGSSLVDHAIVWINMVDFPSDTLWNSGTLDCPTSIAVTDVTGTLVHELGHCLGLNDWLWGTGTCSVMEPEHVPAGQGACGRRDIKEFDRQAMLCFHPSTETTWGHIKKLYETYSQGNRTEPPRFFRRLG